MQVTKNSITFQPTLRWRNTHRGRSLLKYKVTTETHLQHDRVTKEKQHRTHERYAQKCDTTGSSTSPQCPLFFNESVSGNRNILFLYHFEYIYW